MKPETVWGVLAEMLMATRAGGDDWWHPKWREVRRDYADRIEAAHAREIAALRQEIRMEFADALELRVQEIAEIERDVEQLTESLHKHQAKIAEKDAEIERLKAQVDESARIITGRATPDLGV